MRWFIFMDNMFLLKPSNRFSTGFLHLPMRFCRRSHPLRQCFWSHRPGRVDSRLEGERGHHSSYALFRRCQPENSRTAQAPMETEVTKDKFYFLTGSVILTSDLRTTYIWIGCPIFIQYLSPQSRSLFPQHSTTMATTSSGQHKPTRFQNSSARGLPQFFHATLILAPT